jgi:FkbM family methyltransferase
MFSLLEMLGRAAPRLDIVDVGAMWTGESDGLGTLLKGDHAHVVGFEPVQAECDKLNAMNRRNHTFLPYFIGDGSEATFYLCKNPMTSSLYEPNLRLLRKFANLADLTTPVSVTRVQTRRLDDIPQIASIDLLKADVQGGELNVLKGARRLLSSAVAVQVEVAFVPMYLNQPLFADVDAELRSRGFLVHRVASIQGRPAVPMKLGRDETVASQSLWTDVVYIKDFTRPEALTQQQFLKLAIILHDGYGSVDMAGMALAYHDAKLPDASRKGLWDVYMRRLVGSVPAIRPPLD